MPDVDRRYILRHDRPERGTLGWQVRIRRSGQLYTRFFSDSRWKDDAEASFAAAQKWRDHMLREEVPEPIDKTEASAEARAQGARGVHLQLREITRKVGRTNRRRYVDYAIIQASWTNPDGTETNLTRSVEKAGLRKTLWRVLQQKARAQGISEKELMVMYRAAFRTMAKKLADSSSPASF